MGSQNKRKTTKNNRKEDGKFHSKNIKHNKGESARDVFGLNTENTDHDIKNGSL